ncbi:uncharacterized protein N0V89_003703 [Didymosphaeria variabile]|uniref:Uncharacterized protein n=1 Tax=Didymosphaeria variabile TaxID=1932322 RepID=A0A9W8XQS9_9PLEO|nr:uncharacterized protein N0V89_003703 [Didymosphaeria variabile]KAJ4355683.1 hypothetical protein N0V89_003703 [Didymosphaeria variabile]
MATLTLYQAFHSYDFQIRLLRTALPKVTMRYFPLVSLTLIPTLALAGTISFASNTECEGGTEQTVASYTCSEAPAGLTGSFLVTDTGGCDSIGFYDNADCTNGQAYYSETDILKFCLAPKYSFTHYDFTVC